MHQTLLYPTDATEVYQVILYKEPILSSVHSTNPYTNIKHNIKYNFFKVSSFNITFVKNVHEARHSGTVNHSIQFINARFKKIK